MGTAYAVWTSIGSVGTALTGLVLFGEPASIGPLALLLVMVGTVIGLKLIEGEAKAPVKPAPPQPRAGRVRLNQEVGGKGLTFRRTPCLRTALDVAVSRHACRYGKSSAASSINLVKQTDRPEGGSATYIQPVHSSYPQM